ncbi:hypothetical protein THAOC_16076, partial [Thalassiosira oceanica]
MNTDDRLISHRSTPLFFLYPWILDVFAKKPINTLSILLALLYADDAYFASTSKSILQKSMDILTELFDRVGLRTNTEKTKVMTCVNEKVQVRRSEEVYRNTTVGFHTEKDWRNRRVACDTVGWRCLPSPSPVTLNPNTASTDHGSLTGTWCLTT